MQNCTYTEALDRWQDAGDERSRWYWGGYFCALAGLNRSPSPDLKLKGKGVIEAWYMGYDDSKGDLECKMEGLKS